MAAANILQGLKKPKRAQIIALMSDISIQTKLIIILGYNGTGKSTIVKKFLLNELKHDRRALVITPDDIEFNNIPLVYDKRPERLQDYKGARRMIFKKDETLQAITDYYTNGLLIFDDCRAYLRANMDNDLHEIFIRRRQKALNIIAVGHGFTEVPPKFFTFASEIILFKTVDNIQKRKDVIKDFDRMKAAQEYVNSRAIDNPHYYKIISQS